MVLWIITLGEIRYWARIRLHMVKKSYLGEGVTERLTETVSLLFRPARISFLRKSSLMTREPPSLRILRVFFNSVRAPAQCLQEASFPRPTASFSGSLWASQRFPLSFGGSSQGAKHAPAGRSGAGRGAALHVSSLPGGSPQPSEPLIGFRTGAYLCPRASFGLVGAESGDFRTMAPVHGEDCELETSGEGRAGARGTLLGKWGSQPN